MRKIAKLVNIYIYIYIYISKVGDRSRGLPVGSLFNSYYSEVLGRVLLLYFDLRPGPKCHSRWCTGRKWHIPMAVRRGNRVGGNWLMKWDKLKIPWYSHRLTHRMRVTSELHDSYFRLMTIKHAISNIEWTLNYYITQSRQKLRQFEFQLQLQLEREL